MVKVENFLVSTANKDEFSKSLNDILDLCGKESKDSSGYYSEFKIDYKPLVITDEVQYIVYTALITVKTVYRDVD